MKNIILVIAFLFIGCDGEAVKTTDSDTYDKTDSVYFVICLDGLEIYEMKNTSKLGGIMYKRTTNDELIPCDENKIVSTYSQEG